MTVQINLLPDALAKRLEHRRQLRKWGSVWAVVAAVLSAAHLALQDRQRESGEALQEMQTIAGPLHDLERRTEELRSKSDKLRAALARQCALEQADVPLALLQVVAECCSVAGPSLQLDAYRMDEAGDVPSAAAALSALRPAPGRRLILSGTAAADGAVSAFVERLRNAAAFDRVDLEASQSTGDASAQRSTFQIQCELSAAVAAAAPDDVSAAPHTANVAAQ